MNGYRHIHALSSDQPEKDLVAGLPTEELEIEEEPGNALLAILPGDGSTIGNQAARQALSEQVGREMTRWPIQRSRSAS